MHIWRRLSERVLSDKVHIVASGNCTFLYMQGLILDLCGIGYIVNGYTTRYIFIFFRRYKRKGSKKNRHAWKGWQRSDGDMGWQQGFHLASGWGQLFGFMCLAAAVGTLQLPDGSQAAAEIAKDLAVDMFVAQLWTAKLESQTVKITCIFFDFPIQYASQCLRVRVEILQITLSLSLSLSHCL